eukprot:TRINITY_DN2864_c1_g1_i1.p2 TRINITY_DN2864_c1_g1~~TRINITY_DN2864_c1_g1_i1.p2  ORF type:complete len:186 (+),score=43.83 TRINITY_DN2864_c1_g1_i1:414-971(+)
MGNVVVSLFQDLVSQQPREVRILMLGLDSSGKTTILYKLKLGEVLLAVPTIGFNVETVEFRGLTWVVWDMGGQDRVRRLWRYYFEGTHALIFVVDSSDVSRIDEAQAELERLLEDEDLKDISLLVFANKCDLPNALSAKEISTQLKLQSTIKNSRKWHVQSSCAITGEGLLEGIDWLATSLREAK